jgi:hypothetical protein
MESQALSGPLPGSFELIARCRENFRLYHVYGDRKTGLFVSEDPRLGLSLPEGVRTMSFVIDVLNLRSMC